MKKQTKIYRDLEKLCVKESYWSKNKNTEYFKRSSDNLIRLIEKVPHQTILEVGCSDGAFTKRLKKISRRVVGIDVSKSEIKRAKKNVKDVKFIATSLEKYARANRKRKFDVIVCSEVLYYILKKEDALKALQKLGRFVVTSHFFVYWPTVSIAAIKYEIALGRFDLQARIIEKSFQDKMIVVKSLRKLSTKL